MDRLLPRTVAESQAGIFTPEDIMAGVLPAGPVAVYDEDQYYMGGCLAMKLAQAGLAVTLVTPGTEASGRSFPSTEHSISRALRAFSTIIFRS